MAFTSEQKYHYILKGLHFQSGQFYNKYNVINILFDSIFIIDIIISPNVNTFLVTGKKGANLSCNVDYKIYIKIRAKIVVN